MENKFKESRFIEQIMVVGEGEKFPSAFIVPNFAFIREWGEDNDQDLSGLSNADIAKSKLVTDRIEEEINRYNKDYGNWEQIKKFALLEKEFSIAANELTPTLKLKRKKIMENYQAEYSTMYLN
jgi:long-chain acyl-CoA synthetase